MRLTLLVALSLLVASCADHQFDNPAAPSTPSDLTAPARLTLDANPGRGDSAGTAAITATVSNGLGAGVGAVTVSFSVDTGSIPDTAVTSSTGVATVTLTGRPGAAKVIARAGTLTSSTLVALQSPPPPLPLPPAPPVPPPPLPPAPLSVFLRVTPAVAGSATQFGMSINAPLASAVWGFGDSSPAVTTTTGSTSHVYTVAAEYRATLMVTDTSGRTASTQTLVSIANPPPAPQPPTPAPPTLSASLTCPTPSTLTAGCNVTAAYGGATVPSAAITRVDWDWGDGAATVTLVPESTHLYPQAGTYVVFATVTATADGASKTAVTSKSVTVP